MKKLSITVVLLLIFVAYAIRERNEAHVSVLPTKNSSSSTTTSSNSPSSRSSNAPTSTPDANQPTNQQPASGAYKDGTYTGNTADAYYGPMQVQITVSNGKISDVQVLQYPNDRGESIEINNQALPQLKQEAIQAQNAQIDIVSGATQSSQGFQQSLQSALDHAKS